MTLEPKYLQLEQITRPVALSVDDRFVEALDFVFPKWPYKIEDSAETAPFVSVIFRDDLYVMTSEYMDRPTQWADPLNAICALIVEIAWARLRDQPELLCLHGAAVEINGRLVVMPATRRAGKSTLTVGLAAAGYRIFTDDFLPVALSGDQTLQGLSNGISPRLRMPLPDSFGDRANLYVNNRSYIANRQYRYVTPKADEIAAFGTAAPLGALVYLERDETVSPDITPMPKAEALQALITQNFSRAINAQGILKLFDFATSELPIYRLRYQNIEDAIALLEECFSEWVKPLPKVEDAPGADMFNLVHDQVTPRVLVDIRSGQLIQRDGVLVAEANGKRFLSGADGKAIHLLNDLATAIWTLLEEPTSLDEAVELVCAAFPDQPREQIETDVAGVLKSFSGNGLIISAAGTAMPDAAPRFAEARV